MNPYNSNRKTWIAVIAAASGNLLEFYDFAVYAYFVATIAKLFFPNQDPVVSLLQTFAAYGIGFIARPFGSLIIGRIGDIKGRKPAMILTVTCMAIGSIGIGLVPSYESIGVAAPILLVSLRALQGFAAGGEYGTSTAFIVESSPPEHRGFFGSFQTVSASCAALLASVVASLLSLVPADVVHAWAWRVPFVAGGIAISLFSIFLRAKTEETPEYEKSKKEAPPIPVAGSAAFKLGLKAFGFTIFWTVLSYLVNAYMVTYTQREAGLTREQALLASNIALLVQTLLLPVAGAMSDRVGRKPLLLGSCLLTAIAGYPILHMMSSGASFQQVLLLQCCLGALFALFSGPAPATICEIFPTKLRTTWMSVGFTLSVSIFGGFSPLVSTWLISTLHMPAAPSLLIVPAAIISGLVICTLPVWRRSAIPLNAH
ncbi:MULTISPECIES: MFS transporter [Caballeronia]|uniref:MFS transporter n=1 Tax=Caballeronia TaxID=1827195 RepID=UPI00025BB9BA|nr:MULTISPECIES: MFS transporter [Caballeronia]EKS72480.1 major facilitator family transporter [Burkholderia sp. SJ98]KAK45432.1 major facilitator transporter [Caballeronia jiangsuensis]MCE4548072.1 MFS transporter [Caballeronia sp. PC1]MCE4575910.1 MFS transporter [Caballeronia sp. CLC5]